MLSMSSYPGQEYFAPSQGFIPLHEKACPYTTDLVNPSRLKIRRLYIQGAQSHANTRRGVKLHEKDAK